jgi:hypothetical protein
VTQDELTSLLERCEQGVASPEELTRLEALLGVQERALPLGALLEEALASDTVRPEIGDAVLSALPTEDPWPALRHDLASTVAGLARAPEVDVVNEVLQSVEPPSAVRCALDAFAEGLAFETESLDLTDNTMSAIQASERLLLQASALLDGEIEPEARGALSTTLLSSTQARHAISSWADLGQRVRASLAASVAGTDLSPTLPKVFQAVGLQDSLEAALGSLKQGIAAESDGMDLAPSVLEAIRPAPRRALSQPEIEAFVRLATAPEPVPAWRVWMQRLPFLGVAVASATLVLLFAIRGDLPLDRAPGQEEPENPPFELAELNDVEIQDLIAADNAMVQVFQLDEGAPMVIFIDEDAPSISSGVML